MVQSGGGPDPEHSGEPGETEGVRIQDELDEEGKAIEAGKEDEHSKEPLPGGFGQDMAQTIAKEE